NAAGALSPAAAPALTVAFEPDDLAGARVNFHLDPAAFAIAAFDLPCAVVELDLANGDDAIADGNVLRHVRSDSASRHINDVLRCRGRQQRQQSKQRGGYHSAPDDSPSIELPRAAPALVSRFHHPGSHPLGASSKPLNRSEEHT